MKSITADYVVRALRDGQRRLRAAHLAYILGTTSRAIATALRGPVRDGRVHVLWRKGLAHYRFVRLTAKGRA